MYCIMYCVLYCILSKFGGCKRQDSPAKRTPRTNGKFSRRCARHGVRENPESAIGSCAVPALSVPACARALVRVWPRMRPECGLERRQTSLCAVFASKTFVFHENVAVRGVCGLSCFRPSFRIALANVFATGRRKTSLCAHVAKIAFSPTRNAKSNKQIDTSRAKRPCEMRSKSGALAYAKCVSEGLAYAKHRF